MYRCVPCAEGQWRSCFKLKSLVDKSSSEIIEKLRLRNFQGPQESYFDFSTLYTSLTHNRIKATVTHNRIKATVLCLFNWCFNREAKKYLCRGFSNKKFDSHKWLPCTELCKAFTFLMVNVYVQFDNMVYLQIVGRGFGGTDCDPLIANGFCVLCSQILTVLSYTHVSWYLLISWRYIHNR